MSIKFEKVKVAPLNKKITKRAKNLHLYERLLEKIALLEEDLMHPSLDFKLLRPHHRGIWQIKITDRYRAHLIVIGKVNEETALAEVIFVGDPHK